MEGIVQSKSKTFLTFCFCFLVGTAVASVYNQRIDFVFFYAVCFALIGLTIIFWKQTKARFVLWGALFIIAGVFRYSVALPANPNIPDDRVQFRAFVSAEPDVRQDGVRYILEIENEAMPASRQDLRIQNVQRVYSKLGLYPRYSYGDVLLVNCRLQQPRAIQSFRYDMYLRRFGIDAMCNNPVLEKVGSGSGNPALRQILFLKQSLAKNINALWHEPYAGFMSGLLYGYRGGLGTLNEDFNRTGVTHIVAISGYNISILATVLLIMCTRLFIPRQKAFWLVTAAIILFVIFTGASGSVVRAGIMGFLVLLAQQLGRLKRMANVLAFTAVLMVLHNPFVLAWDAGFQLSFIATLGLIYLAPTIQKPFERLPEWFGIRESAIATMAAIIATLPLIMYQFGRVSLVAPIVNILILWIIPWVMLLGFLSVSLSIIAPASLILSWIAWGMMRYAVGVVNIFSPLPFASVDVTIPFAFVPIAYSLLIVWVVRSYHRNYSNR